jgi:hypothetical protein
MEITRRRPRGTEAIVLLLLEVVYQPVFFEPHFAAVTPG